MTRALGASRQSGFLLCLALVLLTFSPSLAGSDEAPIPYASQIDARVEEDSILLTWKKAESRPDHYVIVRAPVPINDDTYPEKTRTLETLSAEHSSYRSSPPDTSPYYYAVLSAGSDGSVLSLFIPHRNVTAEPVALSSASAADAVRIRELDAETRDDRIVIRLEADRAAPPILLYRSTSPILSGDDVVQASLIATIGEGTLRYTDFPLAGVEYYYAAIDARLAEAGRYRFEEGRNSLAEPVQLAITNTAGGTPPAFAAHEMGHSRSTPLPFLQVNRSIVSGEPLSPSQAEERQAAELAPETRKRIDTLLDSFPEASAPHLKPTLLPEDERSPRSSDAQTLKTIVTGPFAEEEWDATEKRLGQLLSTRISEAVRRRAHFYLAQCYFYQQDYTAAFFEFVLLEDTMYDRVQAWLYRIIELR